MKFKSHLSDGLPVGRVLAEEKTNGLEGELDDGRRIAHRANFNLDEDRYCVIESGSVIFKLTIA